MSPPLRATAPTATTPRKVLDAGSSQPRSAHATRSRSALGGVAPRGHLIRRKSAGQVSPALPRPEDRNGPGSRKLTAIRVRVDGVADAAYVYLREIGRGEVAHVYMADPEIPWGTINLDFDS